MVNYKIPKFLIFVGYYPINGNDKKMPGPHLRGYQASIFFKMIDFSIAA